MSTDEIEAQSEPWQLLAIGAMILAALPIVFFDTGICLMMAHLSTDSRVITLLIIYAVIAFVIRILIHRMEFIRDRATAASLWFPWLLILAGRLAWRSIKLLNQLKSSA